ncbi:two-component system response regulator YesN [Natranaerovirga pectinivora]|uniref:Stage 0 sporulation protein A homolog n=1 Tax=Natranaerovirga pectinivora TaxID=682400 RepID=A0A4R3MQR5_9FIRM|nr:response regulator [Natranaerovirga pectinivora]TCT16246.1 two-component system response regulator YesN [Natranaerovirga pectinivora]
MYKLLIADDEALEREALKYFVTQSELEISSIIESATGTETVKKVLLEKPDIILLDINMPGLNGLEALERIQVANDKTKVIFSTAYNYFEYAIKALQLGAMDFMVKPVKQEQVITILNKAIDQLDGEKEKKSQNLKINEMIEYMGKKIVRELICGNITEDVLFYLEAMNIGLDSSGNCFFIRLEEEFRVSEQKRVVITLKKEFENIGCKTLLNWKNNTLTILMFNQKDISNDLIDTVMKKLLFTVLKKHNLVYSIGIGLPFEEISQIEESYNYARSTIGDLPVQEIEKEQEYDGPTGVKEICEFIEENYNSKINLDDIANAAGFSKYHISRIFKQHMGTTIIDYLTQKRINKARELLKEGNYSIKQISSMVGYSDPNYFTWTFKKIEGVSPVKYRYK